jgi:hypothetical protein
LGAVEISGIATMVALRTAASLSPASGAEGGSMVMAKKIDKLAVDIAVSIDGIPYSRILTPLVTPR